MLPAIDKKKTGINLRLMMDNGGIEMEYVRTKIIKNMIRCKYCDDVIESETRHDMKWCSCGRVAVDGGHDYLRRCFTDSGDDYEELSVSEFDDTDTI